MKFQIGDIVCSNRLLVGFIFGKVIKINTEFNSILFYVIQYADKDSIFSLPEHELELSSIEEYEAYKVLNS